MALDYGSVKDMYDTLYSSGVTTKTLPEWSTEMNDLTGTDLYTAGLHDNWIKRASHGIDKLLESTGLPGYGEIAGRAVGSLVGAPEAGAELGRGLPRATLNFAPLLIPGGGWAGAAAKFGLTGALTGAETYEKTDSPLASLISGATATALPGIAGKTAEATGQVLSKLIGVPSIQGPIADLEGNIVRNISERIPQTFGQKAVVRGGSELAGQAAAAGVVGASQPLEQLAQGQEPTSPFTVENLLGLTLGQAPFAAIHLGKRAFTGSPYPTADSVQKMFDLSKARIDLKEAKQVQENQTGVEKTVDTESKPDNPETIAATELLLSQVRGEQIDVKKRTDLTDEQKLDELNKLMDREHNLLKEKNVVTGDTVFGNKPTPDQPRQEVVGNQLFSNKNGTWRAVHVSDDPANPEELRGKVIGYSTLHEPTPQRISPEGTAGKYSLPDAQWRRTQTIDEWNSRFRKNDAGQPELPAQGEPMSVEELNSYLHELDNVETSVDGADTPGDLQKSVVDLQAVQHQNDLTPTTDAKLAKTTKVLTDNGIRPDVAVKATIKVEAKRTARKIQASTRELERATPELTPEEAADISARMGGQGFSVMTADKLSHTATSEDIGVKPVADMVTDAAMPTAKSPVAQAAFNNWSGRADTTYAKDFQDYVDLVENYGSLSKVPLEEAGKMLAERTDAVPWDAAEVSEFINRPHVQEWGRELDNQLAQQQKNNIVPAPVPIPAGDKFVYSLGDYDPATNTLNQKHRLPKDGKVVTEAFRSMAGIGKPLQQAEVDFYKQIVPEAFDGAMVDVPKLYEGLKTKGPQVETKKLGVEPGSVDDQSQRQHQEEQQRLLHEIDTAIGTNWNEIEEGTSAWNNIPKDIQDKITRWHALDELAPVGWEQVGGQSSYQFVAPKPEAQMPGYVEGLVRLPTKASGEDLRGEKGRIAREQGLQYQGPHFGSEDTNVLAFYRGYEETLSNGEKAFHVIEVQSDWGQHIRENRTDLAQRPTLPEGYELKNQGNNWWVVDSTGKMVNPYQRPSRAEALGEGISMIESGGTRTDYRQNVARGQEGHPLLKLYETLALKAAIAHAKEVGATKLILSDAETAMMTEGHDRISGVHPEDTNVTVSQEKGMRLHYDQSMSSILEKLTGGKGENVDLGPHKNAIATQDEQNLQGRQDGSPIFKDANGQPKTQITGRSYDISQVPGQFTLTEPTRAPGTVGRGDAPVWLPQEQRDVETIDRMGLAKGGQGMLNFLLNGQHFSGLAKDLAKFTDSLARIRGSVRQIDNGAFIKRLPGDQTEIVMSPALLRASPFDQEYSVAHELIHGLSLLELDKPTNRAIYAQIDDLRNRVIDQLPKDMGKAFKTAFSSDWLNKWGQRQVTFESLMPRGTAIQRGTLYALLNNHEFVAQGLSERTFGDFLKGIKTGNETWYHRFTGLIKNMLGLSDNITHTAFEEFLSKTDQLLDHGNYVSSFRNFSARYFENLGMSKQFVDSSTQRAMGILTSDLTSISPDIAITFLRQGAGVMRTPEWMKAQRDVTRMFSERGDDAVVTQRVLDETGHKADASGLLDFTDSLMLGEVGHDALDLLPEPALRHVLETAKDAQNIFGSIRAATLEQNKGVLNIAAPKLIHDVAKATLKGIDKLVAQDQVHDMQVRDIQNLFNVPPDGFYSNVIRSPEVLPEWAHGDTKKSWFNSVARFLEPIGQTARRIPEAAEAYSRGWELRANVRNMARESLKALGMDLSTMQLTPKTVKDAFRVFTNPTLRKAADKWIATNNIEGEKSEKGVSVIDADDARIQKIIGGLSPTDREIVEDMVNKHSISTQHMQEQVLEKGLQTASTDGGALLQKLAGGKLKDSVDTAGTLLRAFTSDRSDPNAASIADAQIQKVQSGLDPDTFLTIARFTKAAADRWTSQKEGFDKNPGWSTAQRFGKYLVEYRKGGKSFLDAVDSKKEAEALTEGRPYKLSPNKQYDEDRPPGLGFNVQAIADRIRGYDQNMIDILQNTGTYTPDQIAQIKQYSGGEQFLTEEAYRGGVQGLSPQPRRLTKGAEELPWLRNHVSWIHQTSNAWSRQLLKAQARAHLSDPEIASNEQLHANLQTHYENMLQPDTATGRFFQRAAMTWFMGYNPASAMINGTQPFLTHVAEFTNMTGKPLDSYRRVLSGLKEVFASGLGHREWKDPVTTEFMKRFIQDGEADISMFDDQAAGQELLHTNLVRMLNGDKPQTLGQKMSTMAGNVSNVGMWMFKTVERINAMSAGISAYKYYRESEPNLSPDEAYAKAVNFHHAVNFGGGAAARPVGAFSGRGAFPRTTAMLATAMQSYNLGTMFQIARYIRSGFFRPEGLTPHEVYSARKAAVQMLGTQLAAAGVLGLPFVSGMLSVLSQAFPDLEVNRKLRESMNTLLGEDADSGHVLTDMSMTGVPSMMGWDLQSRLSMGNTVPGVSEINGFQPENLLGAPANLVSSFLSGGYKLASGDPHAVDAFMPSALKKLEQLLRSGGHVLDYRNRPIFTPTLGEKVGIALGFNPKRLSDYNVAARVASQTDDNIKRREGQFHQELAREVLKGNFGTVRQALLQRSRENKTYDPAQAVRSISSAAEELTFPRDLRREGTLQSGDVRSKLLATFNLPSTQPSEVDRARFRQSVQQRLGLVTTSPTDLSTAQLVDQLRQSNPTASRSELRQQASLLLHGQRRSNFSLQQE